MIKNKTKIITPILNIILAICISVFFLIDYKMFLFVYAGLFVIICLSIHMLYYRLYTSAVIFVSSLSALLLLVLSSMLVVEYFPPLAGDLALNMSIALVSVLSSALALIWLFVSMRAIADDGK